MIDSENTAIVRSGLLRAGMEVERHYRSQFLTWLRHGLDWQGGEPIPTDKIRQVVAVIGYLGQDPTSRGRACLQTLDALSPEELPFPPSGLVSDQLALKAQWRALWGPYHTTCRRLWAEPLADPAEEVTQAG